MYRRPKFLETLIEIREQMALEADHDVAIFAEMARTGKRPPKSRKRPESVETKPAATAAKRRTPVTK